MGSALRFQTGGRHQKSPGLPSGAQTDRQTDRDRDRQADRQRYRQTEIETDRHIQIIVARERGAVADRKIEAITKEHKVKHATKCRNFNTR